MHLNVLNYLTMATKKFNSDAKSHGCPSKSYYEIPAKPEMKYTLALEKEDYYTV